MIKNITNFPLEKLQGYDQIFCLVSGGIDSTYLFELLVQHFPDKVIPVNCYNPFEQSKTLSQIQQNYPNFLQIKPDKSLNYKHILRESFLLIDKAIAARKEGKYNKKIFPCCKLIKHDAFKKDPLFQTPNTVVISGIKAGDGFQRGLWLLSLRTGEVTTKGTQPKIGFFHTHKWGATYCYPFRDYFKRELPQDIIQLLKKKYLNLKHSGCIICPVLVVFHDRIKKESIQMKASWRFYHKLRKSNCLEKMTLK